MYLAQTRSNIGEYFPASRIADTSMFGATSTVLPGDFDLAQAEGKLDVGEFADRSTQCGIRVAGLGCECEALGDGGHSGLVVL